MTPVNFLLDPHYIKQTANLDHVAEFTLHVPALIWEWTTWFHLKNAGHDVRIVGSMPEEGIVVTSACMYPLMQKPPANVLLIDTLADTPPRFYSHIHVSQNPWQHKSFHSLLEFPIWSYINIWPQRGIAPRDAARGLRFENVGFFGHRDQLEPSLQSDSFQQELEKRDLRLIIVDRDFTDYTNIDAVIAVRDFTRNPQYHKPNSKLINGWKAGVPVLATNESAFVAMRQTPLDFIEISSSAELLAGLEKLKSDPALVENMVANGKKRVVDYSHEKILGDWEKLLFEDAQQLYEKWRSKSKLQKEAFYADQIVSRGFRSVGNKIRKKLQKA